MGKTTDSLIWQSYDLSQHPNQREMDVLLSTGEIISSALLAIALNSYANVLRVHSPLENWNFTSND